MDGKRYWDGVSSHPGMHGWQGLQQGGIGWQQGSNGALGLQQGILWFPNLIGFISHGFAGSLMQQIGW